MKRIVFVLFFIFILVGCTQQEIKEGQVYVMKDNNHPEEQLGDMVNIEGRIPFQKYVNESLIDQYDSGRILLTISPNGKEIYFMERVETDNLLQVIKGETREEVIIVKEDINSKEQQVIVENIPFISKIVWNSEGSMVAFGGGGRLTIYDVKNNSVVVEEKLAQDKITNFFWSPTDENKLYSEQLDLANASIYYLDSQKKVEAYETREETYYKGKLDSNYYYGTKWDLANDDTKTVILDKQGKIIKILTSGRFRDAYQKSLVVVGERGFGLYYMPDINASDRIITLTKEYIYDVKFIDDGKIAYTTKAEDIETNLFYLHIVSNTGSELKKLKVHGGSIAVLPDGKSGFISGPKWQRVDFVENKFVEDLDFIEEEEIGELQQIYTTIRGAMTTFYNLELKGEGSRINLQKYFKNTSLPEQWAYFDMEKILQERDAKSQISDFVMEIHLKSYDIGTNNASVTIGVNTRNPYGRGVVMDYAMELIKYQGNWYVTGFSTFPYSPEREEVEEILQEVVEKIQMGKLFSGELANKAITIGQIQFWLSGMAHLAPNVESANSVKVFLQVEGEDIYKLVLEKINHNSWKPIKLTQENLSSL
ncbi:hypothetical protein CACET_c13780 [Clostridium aceticum]|uniref:Uncharacterized protein n=1 Tax=Clostridium aceticum TaxID=84022 RepID=A0A0G3W914_9CLOT|nr:hypothetical protein [Clostridium aceticum]AKL94843.1 hypothetical protein CACET_c13780 [Clostridium aceticum]